MGLNLSCNCDSGRRPSPKKTLTKTEDIDYHRPLPGREVRQTIIGKLLPLKDKKHMKQQIWQRGSRRMRRIQIGKQLKPIDIVKS